MASYPISYWPIFVANIVGNLVSSRLSTRFGLRNTVIWMGAVGSAISTPLLFYMPQMYVGDFTVSAAVGALYGLTLGGFVPLSALMPLLVPKNRAAALSVLSLGAGASTWVGPAIVAIFGAALGVGGIIWIFAGLYALSAFLMIPLRDPEGLREEKETAPVRAKDADGRSRPLRTDPGATRAVRPLAGGA